MSTDPSLTQRLGAGRVARLAPYLLLGPISGPLTAGIVLNFKGGRPVLGGLYGLMLSLWLTVAPLELARAFGQSLLHL